MISVSLRDSVVSTVLMAFSDRLTSIALDRPRSQEVFTDLARPSNRVIFTDLPRPNINEDFTVFERPRAKSSSMETIPATTITILVAMAVAISQVVWAAASAKVALAAPKD